MISFDIENPYVAYALRIHQFFTGPTPIEDMSVNELRAVLNRARLLELNEKKDLTN
jgi:hypothetical protein